MSLELRIVLPIACALSGGAACGASSSGTSASAQNNPAPNDAGSSVTATNAHLPLASIGDVDLPGKSVRFDYQDIDVAQQHLVVAHMNDASVLVLNLSDGSVAKVVPNVPTARGVVVADDVGRIFVTSSPNQLVIIDNTTLGEIGRVTTGNSPDGVGWDPTHKVVGVSDQGDGAISLIPNSGDGTRTQVPLGVETGNVAYDVPRGWFWITVVESSPPDQLVAIDPTTAKIATSISLPGCSGAHGLRIHPDGQSALIACEGNDSAARVDLGGTHAIDVLPTGLGPDVLSIDPSLGWLYVAAESGDLTVFDIGSPGFTSIDKEHVGSNAHSVAVDPATHRVFFPLMTGPNGTPVLRIMQPSSSTGP